MKNEYLNEERYHNTNKKVSKTALIVLIVGLLIGLSLITLGIVNMNKVNSENSEENKQNEILRLESEIEKEEIILENKKQELKAKGITYDAFTEYDEGEAYDLKIITKALDPSFDNCAFNEYKNNDITKKYCSLKNELDDLENSNVNFNRSFNSFKYIPLFMIGGFVIVATLMIAGSIYMISKRREITAYGVQQVMPVAQEGIEKIAPTIGKVGGEIAKTMAPVYGDIAKEISKGIKEGLKDEDK